MDTITQIEVTAITNTIVGILANDRPDWEVITNTFIFESTEQAKKFASKHINRHSTVIVTDVTDERDEVLFNSKRFDKISDAKKALKEI